MMLTKFTIDYFGKILPTQKLELVPKSNSLVSSNRGLVLPVSQTEPIHIYFFILGGENETYYESHKRRFKLSNIR